MWRAWTEPDALKAWWGPLDLTATEFHVDLRTGGEYIVVTQSQEGKVYRNKGTYREIRAPEKLVMTNSFADETGNIVPPAQYGMSKDFPLELLITVTLDEEGDHTRMILEQHYSGMSAPDLYYMKQGWKDSLKKLAEYLRKT